MKSNFTMLVIKKNNLWDEPSMPEAISLRSLLRLFTGFRGQALEKWLPGLVVS